MPDLKEVLGLLKDAATIVAFCIGGIWTYFNFVLGRMYKPRLEIAVDGEFAKLKDGNCLVVMININNVGFGRVWLQQVGSAVTVSRCKTEDSTQVIRVPKWTDTTAFHICQNHRWIESKETIKEQLLVCVPDTGISENVWRLELIVTTRIGITRKTVEWNATNIIFAKAEIPA